MYYDDSFINTPLPGGCIAAIWTPFKPKTVQNRGKTMQPEGQYISKQAQNSPKHAPFTIPKSPASPLKKTICSVLLDTNVAIFGGRTTPNRARTMQCKGQNGSKIWPGRNENAGPSILPASQPPPTYALPPCAPTHTHKLLPRKPHQLSTKLGSRRVGPANLAPS